MRTFVQRGTSVALGVWCVCTLVRADAPASTRVDILLARGRAAVARGQSFEAEGAFRDAIQANPRDLRGYLALTQCYLDVAEFRRALEVLSVAERMAPRATELVLLRAQLWSAEGRVADARALLRGFHRRYPHDAQALVGLAELLERTGQLTEALACYRRLQREPSAEPSLRETARLHRLALVRILGDAERVDTKARGF